jgi:hypothetical protein
MEHGDGDGVIAKIQFQKPPERCEERVKTDAGEQVGNGANRRAKVSDRPSSSQWIRVRRVCMGAVTGPAFIPVASGVWLHRIHHPLQVVDDLYYEMP